MARVAGMASRLVRGTAIASGIAAVAGLGIGFAAGEPVRAKDIAPARKLPADLCSRLGDISILLPAATTPVPFTQTGANDVHCQAKVDESTQPAYTAATLDVTITPYAGKAPGAGQPPIPPEVAAKQAFERKPWDDVEDRPYPTRSHVTGQAGGQDWLISVLVQRADIVVQVDYKAYPVEREKAEQAVLVLADRAIWESK